jgi:hypothetical protein
MRSNGGRGALSAALILAIAGAPVLAADEEEAAAPAGIQFGARLGANYSDNYLHSATDEIDTTVGVAGLEVGGSKKTGKLQFSAYGDVEYEEPLENSLEADVVGRMAATGDYQIVPETLDVVAAGLFTQVRPDLFRPESVKNREDVVSLAVGPVARLRLGDFLGAQIQARYTSSDYSLRALDNETTGGELVVGHDGARESFLGIGAGYYDVTYKEKLDPSAVDYTRQQAFARFDTSGARTTIRLDVGYEKVEGDAGDASGPLVRANLTRRLSPSLEAYLGYTSEFPVSDNATIVPPGAVVPDDESVLTAAPRRSRFGSLGIAYARSRTQADLSYMHSVEEGVLATVGERTWQAMRGSVTRNFTATTFGTVFAVRTKEELRGLSPFPIEATETTYGGEFEVLFGRKLSLVLYGQKKDRNSQLIIDRYNELTAGVYVRYGRVDTTAVEGGATAPIGR